MSAILGDIYKQLLKYIDCYEGKDSGWVMSYLESLDTTVWHLDSRKALSFHKLPARIISKHAVANVKLLAMTALSGHFLRG